MARHRHIWESLERFARRHCAAAANDAGVSVLLVLFAVFFLAGATIAVVFAAQPLPQSSLPGASTVVPVRVTPSPPTTASATVARSPAGAAGSRRKPTDEKAVAVEAAADALGLRLSRSTDVLRNQLALGRGVGLVVDDVVANSFAASAGFERHDVLVSLDDQLLLFPAQVPALLEVAGGEAPCRCRLLRGGKPLTISLSLRPTATLTVAVTAEPAADAVQPAAVERAAAVPDAAGVESPTPEAPRAAAAVPTKLRVAASVAAPSVVRRNAEPQSPRPPKAGLLMRVSEDTLLQQDSDYQIKVIGGSEKRLVVRDARGRIIFNDAIETPEQRSLMPLAVRDRVERMERLVEPSSDAPRDDTETAPAAAVVRVAEPARVEWRRSGVPRSDGETREVGTREDEKKPVVEIGRLDIAPIEIR